MPEKAAKKKIVKSKKQLNKQAKRNDSKLQDFFEIKAVKSNHILTTTGQELYYIRITPKNITVMSDTDITNLEENLADVISSVPNLEILCLNSSQNYKENQSYLKQLADRENNEAIKNLDLSDIEHMENIKLSMATSRCFYLLIRCRIYDSENDKSKRINDTMQICKEHNFDVELAQKPEIKKMLAIYLEQNVFDDNLPEFDGEQYGITQEQAEDLQLKSFVDIIAPSVMDFKHSNYYIIGNTYRSVIAVREYATSTKKLHLLSELGEKDGVTLHIYCSLLNGGEQSKVFQQAERRNKSIFNSSKKMGQKVESDENLSDLEKLMRQAHKTKEKFLKCAVYIEMTATDLEKLKELKTTVEQILTSANIIKDNLNVQQRDGFAAAAPFGFNIFQKEFQRVMPASSVANLFPFSYSGKTDNKGIYIGKDVHGSNIIVDFDKRDLNKTNGHISIFGNSGEGKSYLMKDLMCIFRQQQKKLYCCDIDDEYSDLVNSLGGTNIDMMKGNFIINFLEPKTVMFDDDNEEESIPKTTLAQHIAFVKAFFNVYKPDMTSSQLDLLEIMVEKTYNNIGIDNQTDLNSLSSSQFPIASDLYAVVENELNSFDDNAHGAEEMLYTKSELRDLTRAIRSICIGSDSQFFNGHTNIPNANHVNFILKGMLTTNDSLKNAMYFNVFSYMQHKFFEEGSTAVFIDELHEVIKSKIVVDYVRSFIKRGRKKNSNVVIASQNIDDLMLPEIIEYTRPLFSIPTHLFLFYPGKVNAKDFMDTTMISESEFRLFNKPHQGHCFYICGSEKYYIQIIVPKYKANMFGTAGGR